MAVELWSIDKQSLYICSLDISLPQHVFAMVLVFQEKAR